LLFLQGAEGQKQRRITVQCKRERHRAQAHALEIEARAKRRLAPCGAFLKETGEIAGLGGLNPYVYDHRDGTRTIEVEVMYWIALSLQGRGLATEMSRFWVAFAFDVLRAQPKTKLSDFSAL